MDAQAFLVEQLTSNNRQFLRALESIPEARFHRAARGGGHSAAWHALHVAEWTRLLLPPDFSDADPNRRFAYLGWETADFARAVHGEPALRDTESKARILEHLTAELERGTRLVANADAERVFSTENLRTPMGERTPLMLVTLQARHVPYHAGQARVTAVQLEREDA